MRVESGEWRVKFIMSNKPKRHAQRSTLHTLRALTFPAPSRLKVSNKPKLYAEHDSLHTLRFPFPRKTRRAQQEIFQWKQSPFVNCPRR